LCFDPSIECCRSVVYFNIDAPIQLLDADVKIDKKQSLSKHDSHQRSSYSMKNKGAGKDRKAERLNNQQAKA